MLRLRHPVLHVLRVLYVLDVLYVLSSMSLTSATSLTSRPLCPWRPLRPLRTLCPLRPSRPVRAVCTLSPCYLLLYVMSLPSCLFYVLWVLRVLDVPSSTSSMSPAFSVYVIQLLHIFAATSFTSHDSGHPFRRSALFINGTAAPLQGCCSAMPVPQHKCRRLMVSSGPAMAYMTSSSSFTMMFPGHLFPLTSSHTTISLHGPLPTCHNIYKISHFH